MSGDGVPIVRIPPGVSFAEEQHTRNMQKWYPAAKARKRAREAAYAGASVKKKTEEDDESS